MSERKNKSTKKNSLKSKENDLDKLNELDELDELENELKKFENDINLKTKKNIILIDDTKDNQLKESQKEKVEIKKIKKNSQDNKIPEENTIKKEKVKQDKIIKKEKLKFIDLFCGIGGFHQALKNLGFECVFASDIDAKCRKTYELNYNLKPEGDITQVDIKKIPKFDIICGGFPCFVEGTKVLTNSNYKNIEDIKLTDKLLTHTGEYQDILNIQIKEFTGLIYKINIKEHAETISCTEEHPFYIREKKRKWNNRIRKYNYYFDKPKWINACEIKKNSYFGMVINNKSIVPEFGKLILDKEEYWYIMGYYLKNGYIDNLNNCVKLKVNMSNNFLLDIVHNLFEFIKKNVFDKDNIIFNIYDKEVFDIFSQFLNKSEKIMPFWVHDAPSDLLKYFMDGFNSNLDDKQLENDKIKYDLERINLKTGKVKLNTFIENGYGWYPLSNIEVIEIKEKINVYNFEVNKDNSYIVENTIVHNCQAFSKAGNQLGFEDSRGNLFFNIAKIAKEHKPKYMILENVRNLSSHDDGNTWSVIYNEIIKLGYNTYEEPLILNVLHFDIPQNRERVIILCKRKDLGDLPKKPKIPKNPKLSLKTQIKDIIDNKSNNDKYKIDGKMKDVEKIWNEFIQILIKNNISIPKFPIWTDTWDADIKKDDANYKKYKSWIDKNREFYNENIKILKKWLTDSRKNDNWFGAVRKFEWQAGDLLKTDSMNSILWTARGSGIRVKRPDYIPTLVAMSMIPVYGPESRKLSPRELLRLQSFPDTFQYDEKSIFKQVGNAVNVKMIEKCARFLILEENLFA